MVEIRIKPLSVNAAFFGKHIKTSECRAFEEELWYKLPSEPPFKIKKKGKLKVEYIFGIPKRQDMFNCEKIFTDVLQKKYDFDDRNIYAATVTKVDAKKGEEFVMFTILPYEI